MVVWIYGGGYGIIWPPLLAFSLTVRSEGTTQGMSLYILKRTWSQVRKTELFLSSFSIALVPLVNSVHCSNSLFTECFEGFLAGPVVKRRGALNAGLRMYSQRISGVTLSLPMLDS